MQAAEAHAMQLAPSAPWSLSEFRNVDAFRRICGSVTASITYAAWRGERVGAQLRRRRETTERPAKSQPRTGIYLERRITYEVLVCIHWA